MSAPAVPEVAGFPITDDVVLRKRFTHMDVPVLISNHDRREDGTRGEEGTYCYYVSIYEDMLPAGVFDAEFWLPPQVTDSFGKRRVSYDYMSARFADAAWNYGITYYEKLGGIDGEPRGVKLGCDYAHAWDSRFYTLAEVEADATRTVNKLREMYPLFRRCSWTGVYAAEADMVHEDERLFTADGHEKWKAFRAEREPLGSAA